MPEFVFSTLYLVFMVLFTITFCAFILCCVTENHINLSPYLSYMSGGLAGCAATIGSYPFDLLRTILASQGEPKVCLTKWIVLPF